MQVISSGFKAPKDGIKTVYTQLRDLAGSSGWISGYVNGAWCYSASYNQHGGNATTGTVYISKGQIFTFSYGGSLATVRVAFHPGQ